MSHKHAKTRPNWGRGGDIQRRGLDFTMLTRAQAAVEELIKRNSFFEGSKDEFAIVMGWPNRRTVEDVQRLTQDQDMYPVAKERLGGFQISYAPSKGGMLLIGPDGDLSLADGLHFLTGDLQRQQAEKTILRRRIPGWRAIGDQAANAGDLEMARICYQCMNELDSHGFVSDHLTGEYFKALTARGITE